MRPDRLASIPLTGTAFDTETHLSQPGLAIPPLVCSSVYAADTQRGELLTPEQTLTAIWHLLTATERVLLFMNAPYDLLVSALACARAGVDLMPAIFAAYDNERIYDIAPAEALNGIGRGHLFRDPRDGGPMRDPGSGKVIDRYSLAILCDQVLNRIDAKRNDLFRKSYAALAHIPMPEWPVEARQYPVDDVKNTTDVAVAQVWRNENLHNLSAQVRGDWAMALGAAHGFNADPDAVEALDKKTSAERLAGRDKFATAGFLKLNDDGTFKRSPDTGKEMKNTAVIKRRVAEAYGVSGVCETCRGTARVPGQMQHKMCGGNGCPDCGGVGKIPNPKTDRGCPDCDNTGMVLASAPCPRTDTGGVGTGRDALYESGDELLIDFAAWSEADKIQSTYIPFLRQGVGRPLTLRHNVLVASGRASYSDVVHQLPRAGGVRECIVPRPGKCFWAADWAGVELVTHAQSCLWSLGYSKMADALNAGIKPHDALGAEMAGIPYEQFLAEKDANPFLSDCRQAAKPANFGFPGGMGAAKLVLQQRKLGPDTTGPDGRAYKGLRFCLLVGGADQCGVELITEWKRRTYSPLCKRCVECAEDLRNAWFRRWPENQDYLGKIIPAADDQGFITQHVSNRKRAGIDFCSGANSLFQGLAADAFKEALYRIAREQWVVQESPLFGARTILAMHDETIGEADLDRAPEAAVRVGQVMEETLLEFCPDVVNKAEPHLMTCLSKNAKPVYDANGRLIPWSPELAAAA